MELPRPLPFFAVLAVFVGCMPPAPSPRYKGALKSAGEAEQDRPALGRAGERQPLPADLTGPRPVEVFIERAFRENRKLQAERYRLSAMKERVPQATALDDPRVQNTVRPFPNYGPQYSMMGYMPYSLMLSQGLPWFGTLAIRGEKAESEVKVAEAELRAAELKVIAEVKQAYYELYYSERATEVLSESRAAALSLVSLAKDRYTTGAAGQGDVFRAELSVSDLDRELESAREGTAVARAMLAEAIHVSPDAELHSLPTISLPDVPEDREQLIRLAKKNRPELEQRRAALASDERDVELARKKYFPDIELGLTYDLMTTDHAASDMADGKDNYGFLVGFTLPLYRSKLDAALREAEAKAVADGRRFDAERDETARLVTALFAKVRARHELVSLLRRTILPKASDSQAAARNDYVAGTTPFASALAAWQEELRFRLELARMEADLGSAIAELEAAVGGTFGQ